MALHFSEPNTTVKLMPSPIAVTTEQPMVHLFHASLVWPLQLEPFLINGIKGQHWEAFEREEQPHPWRRIGDEFTDDPSNFRERHYREFVSFLPYVQRFLYGEGKSGAAGARTSTGNSPMHVFRRTDIVALRLTLRPDQTPVILNIVHTDLYFFDDLDLIQLNVEVRASDLPLQTVRDILFRFGRAYPSGWDEDGDGLHNVHLAEWLGSDGSVVARSDTERREKYLGFVCQHRSPCISEH
jgi:hypothetical protein